MERKIPRIIKELIFSVLMALGIAAFIAGLSSIIWIWFVLVYPPFNILLAVKWTFIACSCVGVVLGWLDIWEHG